MNDLISRRAVMDMLKSWEKSAPNAQYVSAVFDFEDAVKEMPSAQTEIIKCKDCKYSDDEPNDDGRYWCAINGSFMDYCSDAERREG